MRNVNRSRMRKNIARRKEVEIKQLPMCAEYQRIACEQRIKRLERVNKHVVIQYAQNGGTPLTQTELIVINTGDK